MTIEYPDAAMVPGVILDARDARPLLDDTTQRGKVAHLAGKSFRPRALAYILDLVALNLFNLVIASFAGIAAAIWLLLNGKQPVPFERTGPSELFVSLVLSFSYFVLCEWLYGATLGKALLRMRVVDEAGGPLGLLAAVTRGLARLVDGFLLGLVAYGNMQAPDYQRLGDEWARTLVVSSRADNVPRRAAWRLVVALVLYSTLAFLLWTAYGIVLFGQ